MRVGAFGRLLDSDAPETDRCAVCHARAERLSSTWQGEGIAYHNYQCQSEDCPAGGTIVEHENGHDRLVGPVFGDHDLAVRLATRDRPEVPAEAQEVHA
jgi:hypothetical protein